MCNVEVNSVDVENSGYIFRATGSIVKFDGFMIIYEYLSEDEKENINIPKLEKGEEFLKERNL